MFVKGFLLSKARVKDSTPSNLFKGESISLRGCAKGLFSGNSELVELANLVNAVTVLGEDFIDALRNQILLFVPETATYGMKAVVMNRFDGMHRREWSRLETRAKEHSVKASLKVFLNLVASESEW